MRRAPDGKYILLVSEEMGKRGRRSGTMVRVSRAKRHPVNEREKEKSTFCISQTRADLKQPQTHARALVTNENQLRTEKQRNMFAAAFGSCPLHHFIYRKHTISSRHYNHTNVSARDNGESLKIHSVHFISSRLVRFSRRDGICSK